tara:strand:- start:20768 stop:21445 length:678 start_codon:yes stop_codon:yes gene_type:complete
MTKNREIKSYVLRQGRFTNSQKNALQAHWNEFGIDYSQKKINFSEIFGNNNPVFIEIGFGNGEFLIHISENNPNYNYIGIEVYKPGIGHILKRLATKKIKNVKILNFDAIDVINDMIIDFSLSGVYIMFPDPWHKKKHHKRRMVQDNLIKLLAKKMCPSGLIFISTDWQDYADQILEVISKNVSSFRLLKDSEYLDNFKNIFLTKYEERGLRKGHNISKFVIERL